MQYFEDEGLTKKQSDIKWCIYCEVEFNDSEDIIAAIKSMLKDLEGNRE